MILKNINLLLLLIISCLLISCSTIPTPSTKRETGCIAGRIEFKTNRTFWSLKEGTYNDKITVTIQNLNNKKTYRAISKRGVFYFYNIPTGEYRIWNWKKRIKANSTITVYFMSDIPNFKFTIIKDTFVTLKDISIIAEIPKEFTYKVKYKIFYKEEDIEGHKKIFSIIDKKNLYSKYEWKRSDLSEIKDETKISNEELISNFITKSDNDYYSMEKLYIDNDYYLSFMFFYRILYNLISANYVKNIDENLPELNDQKKFAQTSKIEINPDDMIMLLDITNINEKIKPGDTDDNYKKMFTKQFFEEYLKKINNFRENIKKKIKEE